MIEYEIAEGIIDIVCRVSVLATVVTMGISNARSRGTVAYFIISILNVLAGNIFRNRNDDYR